MKNFLLFAILFSGSAYAQEHNSSIFDLIQMFMPGRSVQTELDDQQRNFDAKVKRNTTVYGPGLNVYGPGVGADRTGRAFHHDPNLRLNPNVYGPGVGQDQFGRPVRHLQ